MLSHRDIKEILTARVNMLGSILQILKTEFISEGPNNSTRKNATIKSIGFDFCKLSTERMNFSLVRTIIIENFSLYFDKYGYDSVISFSNSRIQWLNSDKDYTLADLDTLLLENFIEVSQYKLGKTQNVSMKNIMELMNAYSCLVYKQSQES